ncbi:PepSY-associated TM helix domain-containing protein [Pedobacter steynii]|uniref:Peptidase n=1 Tax=Pedobacter steynii TaxID=430522 RepID=A0A1D7QC53_9SPHI|nr:PepSY-associated TM helix domain-containing protein [Pedobacter steynii]AOM76262.1 peptidase [Pedobacter steynii]
MTVRTTPLKKKKHPRSLFYRISAWLHLWLGLVTGIIMVIVCVTGCLYVFIDEIKAILSPETNVVKQDKPVLTPSQLSDVAAKLYPDKKVSYAAYQQGKAVTLGLGEGRRGNTMLHINPYTGKVIKTEVHEKGGTDFFSFVLSGHRFLWLPYKIGRPIVNYSTLIFVITLITGIVLWWPKKWTKSTRERSFQIKWGASFKRVNYDLHNVLGFYSLFVVLAIGLTGMVYGIEWYSKGLYWVTSAGQSLPDYRNVQSDSLQVNKFYTPRAAMDLAWKQVISKSPEAQGFYYGYPDTADAKSTINIYIYPTAGRYYDNRSFAFDRHTLKEFPAHPVYDMKFSEASFPAKLRKMNYDIHVGSILGLPGKFLAFFASLIGASLPITGFVIWWGKRKKKPKNNIAAKSKPPVKKAAVLEESIT